MSDQQKPDLPDDISRSLEEFKAGKKDSFNVIAEYYLPQLRALAYSLTYSKHDADDAIQETLIKAYKHLDSYRGTAALSTWLCKILINQINTEYRKQQRLQALQIEYKISYLTNKFSAEASQKCASTDFCNIIFRELKELPIVSQAVLTLWLKGLKYSEIAHLHRCSIGTVKSQLSRARKKLRQQLKQYL